MSGSVRAMVRVIQHNWRVVLLGALVLFVIYARQGEVARGIAHCKSGPEAASQECYTDLLDKVFATRGLSTALDAVQKMSASDTSFSRYCHNNMHVLGHAAYTQYQRSGKIAISPGFAYCGYGFYHGFMEEMLAQAGTVSGAEAFCNSLGTATDVSNCYHGIGHGVVDGLDPRSWGDPVAMAAPGIAMCRNVAPDNEELERSCAMGVFNSIELMYPDPKYKLKVGDNPFAWCLNNVYTTNEKWACLTEMSVLTMDITHQDYDMAFGYVLRIDPVYREWTVRYLAIYTFAGGKTPTAAEVIGVCRRVVGEYLNACIMGFAQGLIVYGGTDKKYDAAINFCRDPILTRAQKGLCVRTVLTTDVSTPAERDAVCKKFPKDFIPHECNGSPPASV